MNLIENVERVWMTPTGRWGLLQVQDVVKGTRRATGPSGYEKHEDAEAAVERLNKAQPGRWSVWDRWA